MKASRIVQLIRQALLLAIMLSLFGCSNCGSVAVTNEDGATAVAAGANHTCVLTGGGGVKCWGNNIYGQIGDGTNGNNRSRAIDVTGLASGVVAIAAGGNHTCALTTGGGVKCWGKNVYGQIGDDTSGNGRLTAMDVTGLTSDVAAIAAGGTHTCALTTGGGVKCWGNNDYGQIGDGEGSSRLTAVDVTGLTSDVVAIAAGANHSCALTTKGGVKCWGSNEFNQIDRTRVTRYTIDKRLTAMDVTGLTSDVAAIAAGGKHTCALTTGGGVKCWGYNYYGQIGDGTSRPNRSKPMDVTGLTSGVAAIAAGGNHTCALTTGGGVKCWGNNEYGQIGDGTSDTNQLTAVVVTGLRSGVAAITAGGDHTCALTTRGVLKCWGYNGFKQIGDGTTTHRLTAVDVSLDTQQVAQPTYNGTPDNRRPSTPVRGSVAPSDNYTSWPWTFNPGANQCVRVPMDALHLERVSLDPGCNWTHNTPDLELVSIVCVGTEYNEAINMSKVTFIYAKSRDACEVYRQVVNDK